MSEVLPNVTRLHAVFTIRCQSLQLHELPLDLYSIAVETTCSSFYCYSVRFYSMDRPQMVNITAWPTTLSESSLKHCGRRTEES